VENLDRVREMAAADHGLAAVFTSRADGTGQASVVNAGVLTHPVTGQPVVAFVAAGDALKLRHLRRRPQTTVVFRDGWAWIAVEGLADLVGPDDPLVGVEPAALPQLLRDVFTAAGGTHDDWDEFDRVMAAERRTAVLVVPARVYST
jgi:PPOX class probable F420-dependent enzyme